ncbi:MAG TPA: DUF5777 family beta-barrel protein [Bacteroidia bacterium]|nr:DUF5777 family beta-barrel protein [Bacteroidia bacterium]
MNFRIHLFLSILFFVLTTRSGFAQENMDSLMDAISGPQKARPVMATFKTTRLVNMVTIEQVKRGELDFRISHRFDDIAGDAGGISTLYGFDNVTDIRLGFDYGITDRWAVGFGRSKGAYQRRQILDFNTKLKVLRQTDNNAMPLSVSVFLSSELCTMASSSDTNSTVYFGNSPWHRLNYVSQVLLARKFGERLSLELSPTFVHRNLVKYNEHNSSFALGFGLRYKFTKRFGVIMDYYYNFDKNNTKANGYYAPLGFGIELETGGHVFHLLFANNKGLLESQYITECKENWLVGQFRFGFNISRIFNITK